MAVSSARQALTLASLSFTPEPSVRGCPLTITKGASQLGVDEMASQVIQTESGAEVPIAGTPPHAPHDRGLILIGIFKLGKALLFVGIGLGALHFIHKDLGDTILRIATLLRFDPESRLIGMTMAKVDLIDHHRLREISMATFAYAALALTEGIGLMMEKVWAEYLTLGLTLSFLPWELYELARHATWFRAGLLLINLVVLAYLLWLRRVREER